MSLHDAIDDLRGAAKRLDKATFNPQMDALKKFVDKLDGKALSATPPPDVRQKALEKFLRGDNDFTRRERRALPFIIYESAITLDGVKKILERLNFFKSSHLLRVVSVYLQHHDSSAKTELLRRRLMFVPKEMAGNSTRLKKIFSARDFLFGDNRFGNTAKLFADKQSVNVVLEALGLSNFFKASNFIHAALIKFFRTPDLDAQLKLLDELNADYDAYQKIFPAIADALIQYVDRAGHGKEVCIEIFYRRLGDPRFGFTSFNYWAGVSDKSKEIFLRWLAEDDLTIFFKVTRETLQGNDTALNMWNAREKFWREYLSRIGNTWVVLGSNARRIARRLQDRRKHGRLLGSTDSDKSGFLFQIGQYIFAEWSHDGALRVYPAQRVSNYIGNDFTKTEMMAVKVKYRKPHLGAWQGEVSDWIARHC